MMETKDMTKIFKSLFYLDYKDNRLERNYKIKIMKSTNAISDMFMNYLMIYILTTCLLETLFFAIDDKNSTNIKWNLIFSLLNLLIYVFLYFYQLIKKTEKTMIQTFLTNFVLLFCFLNINLSIISLLIVYFKASLEVVSLTFFIQTLLKFVLSFFVIKGFYNSLTIFSAMLIIHLLFLLSLHVIKAVFVYIMTDFFFCVIVLFIVYISEYYTKIFFYSFNKLYKEKEFNITTLKFFNISYFKSYNYKLTYQLKMGELQIINIDYPISNNESEFHKIEKFINSDFVYSDELQSEELYFYVKTSIFQNNFKFEDFIKILRNSGDNIFSKQFVKFGTIKVKKENEDSYLEMYLKINFYKETNVKIEGLLIDITQSYTKKQTKVNSLILAKNIHDIKSPLFLLMQILNNYKQYSHSISENLKEIYPKDTNNSTNVNPSYYEQIESYRAENNLHLYYLKLITRYILKIIENVNSFSQQQSLKFSNDENFRSSNNKRINIRKFINSCIEFYKIQIKYNPDKSSIKVFAEIDESVPKYVNINKQAFEQILMNLLSNSFKFTHKGEIKVVVQYKLSDANQILKIAVVDTGDGIEKSNIDKLCTPFELTTNKKTGSGLGLSIVNDCLHLMGSKLNIFSEKNKGTQMSFELRMEESNVYEEISLSSSEIDSCDEYSNNKVDSKDLNNNLITNADTINITEPNETISNCEAKTPAKKISNGIHSSFDSIKRIIPKITSDKSVDLHENLRIDNQNNLSTNSIESKHQKKILVIDDDPFYTKHLVFMLEKIFKDIGYNLSIDTSSNPIEGFIKIYKLLNESSTSYDLILIDENMPYMNGSKFVKFYNSLSEDGFYRVPMISISGDVYMSQNKEMLGLFDYIVNKPCKIAELKSIFKRIFN